MSNDLSTNRSASTTWSKEMFLVILLGIVTMAVLVFLMVYVYQQTPSKPLDMMR